MLWDSLVQWFRLCASNAWRAGLIHGQGSGILDELRTKSKSKCFLTEWKYKFPLSGGADVFITVIRLVLSNKWFSAEVSCFQVRPFLGNLSSVLLFSPAQGNHLCSLMVCMLLLTSVLWEKSAASGEVSFSSVNYSCSHSC